MNEKEAGIGPLKTGSIVHLRMKLLMLKIVQLYWPREGTVSRSILRMQMKPETQVSKYTLSTGFFVIIRNA